jgi:RNA 2',3'-cyclic 3'-phosphodiesterase
MGRTMRLFVALELPPQVKAAAEDVLRELTRAGTDVRWVKPENLHVTLKFLGEVEAEKAAAVREAMIGACAGCPPLALAVQGCGAFPSPQRPTVVWLGLTGQVDELAGLATRMEQACEPLGFAPEGRTFQPHLTLGRLRRGRSSDKGPGERPLTQALVHLATWQGPDFRAERVALMQSTLTPQGPIYKPLREVTLG